VFGNGGDPLYFGASADLMTRNLSHRVEVAFPIYDPDLRADVQSYLDLQCSDNTKARRIDGRGHAYYRPNPDVPVRSQLEQYARLRARLVGEAATIPEGAASPEDDASVTVLPRDP
jgi:polyphosphate kinase